jgi:murein DD-endopeptidase MepM/ murein hydrolase activator NlpD
MIKEPKTQIIVKGTKEPPPRKGTGTFSYPARGSITSRYGMRWGRRHTGIDIAAPYGSAVKAAEGGEVIWVGYEGGYGKLIKIDHGANYVSYYGHLSKYYVNVGDKVYKGQKIGAVGNTGNSTGPHVHFEIRKNGVVQNPLNYLK